MKIAEDIIDDIIKKDIHREICKYLKMCYSISNYAVLCDDKILCFAGSDIIDAVNICDFLSKKYPNNKFETSGEFMSFEY